MNTWTVCSNQKPYQTTYTHDCRLLIISLFGKENEYNLKSAPELHARISPYRFRIPDITVLTGNPTDGRFSAADQPPLFTVEIVSPDERWAALNGKVRDHLAMGVGTVIVAEPA